MLLDIALDETEAFMVAETIHGAGAKLQQCMSETEAEQLAQASWALHAIGRIARAVHA
jgi:hypothetical protein